MKLRVLAVFGTFLLSAQYTRVQAQNVLWNFPPQNQTLTTSATNTVKLDWTSTLTNPIMRLWCATTTYDATATDFHIAGNLTDQATGTYNLSLSEEDISVPTLPFYCYAVLSEDPDVIETIALGVGNSGLIVWLDYIELAGQTISLIQVTTSVTAVVISTLQSPTTTSTSRTSTASTTPSTESTGSHSDGMITSASSTPITASTTSPSTASSASQSSTLPTKSPGSPTSGQIAPETTTPPSSSSRPNSTGAIVGGAVGGVALISMVILGLLFLRKYQHSHASPSPDTANPSGHDPRLFTVHEAREQKVQTADVSRMGEDLGTHEKDGNAVPHWSQMSEVQELSEGPNRVRGKEAHSIQRPIELPGNSHRFP